MRQDTPWLGYTSKGSTNDFLGNLAKKNLKSYKPSSSSQQQGPSLPDGNFYSKNSPSYQSRNSGGSGGGGGSSSSSSKSSKKGSDKSDAEKALERARKEQEAAMKAQMGLVNTSFDDLLRQLDTDYGKYKTDMKSEYDRSQEKAIRDMMARQMAYGSMDSEQREQAQERIGTDYAGKYQTFLEQLAQQQASKRSSIGSSRAQALSDIQAQRASTAYQQMQAELAMLQQEFENSLASQAAARAGASAGSGRAGDIQKAIDSLRGSWVAGQPHAYARPGGTEKITQEMMARFGGTADDYAKWLAPGWEDNFWAPQDTKYMNTPTGVFNATRGEFLQDPYGMGSGGQGVQYTDQYGNPVDINGNRI